MRAAAAIALLLAGCGQSGEGPRGGASENQIERLATPQKEEIDPQAAARIEPLGPEELAALGASACGFSRGGRVLLAATESDAIARVAGALRHFTHSGPVGPTGGFFEDRHLSISVGRTGEAPAGEGEAGSWPGRITITNRRANAQVRLDGVWRCAI
jgi:hypothetical protein